MWWWLILSALAADPVDPSAVDPSAVEPDAPDEADEPEPEPEPEPEIAAPAAPLAPAPPVYPRNWEQVYQNAHTVATVGEVFAIGGPPLAIGGVLMMLHGYSSQDEVMLFGAVAVVAGAGAMLVGTPMLAGGSMRMRRSLLERGMDVSGDLGWVTWGLYAGQWVLPILASGAGVPEVGSFLSTGMYIGSAATGAVFRGNVRRAHDSAVGRSRMTWALLPARDGFSVVGAF